MALVNTTGIIDPCCPLRRVSSRSTSTPENNRWSRSSKSCSPARRARPANVSAQPPSTASSSTEVKSPTMSPTSGCSGSRLRTVTSRVKRGLRLQRPITSAYAAITAVDAETCCSPARVFSADHNPGSSRSSRRVNPAAPWRLGRSTSGSSGAGGRLSRRSVQ
ncbi:hypothetical protein SSPIM334S_04381 [Streptomyces spiroverticillatus]